MNQPKHTITSPLVSPEVIAAYFKVSRNTVLNWARDGKIPAVIIGRIYRFDPILLADTLNISSSSLR